MANKLMLYARIIEVNDKRIDLSSGKVIEEKYNSLAELKKLGIKFSDMPEDFVLYEKNTKDGKKEVMLRDIGLYVLLTVDDDGKVINDFIRKKNFSKPIAVDLNMLRQLKKIFNDNTSSLTSKGS